jgi:hypothetical protein
VSLVESRMGRNVRVRMDRIDVFKVRFNVIIEGRLVFFQGNQIIRSGCDKLAGDFILTSLGL